MLSSTALGGRSAWYRKVVVEAWLLTPIDLRYGRAEQSRSLPQLKRATTHRT